MPNNPALNLTPEQRAAALEKAVATRRERAAVIEQIKKREITPAEAMDMPIMAKCRVKQFLMAVPGVGKAKCAAFLESAGIAPDRRLRGLGVNQRQRVLDFVS